MAQTVSPSVFDFGSVPLWKNDTALFTITNTSSTKFIFLPIGYAEDLLVLLPKQHVLPGQSVVAKLVYYTQDRGNFRRSVPIYVSSAGEPLALTIKGKINDFHPDAMLNCPSLIEGNPTPPAEKPIEILVVDAITGKGLTGFNIILKNTTDQQLIESATKDRVYFDMIKNGKYQVNVTLTGYEPKDETIYVNRVTRKFIVKLNHDEGPMVMTDPVPENKDDKPVVLKNPDDKEEERKDIEKLREKFNDMFKDKKIIEKDVMVVKDGDKDSLKEDPVIVNKTTLPDFTPAGTLNREKYGSNNIVFLIDVSGSMDKPTKLPYLKKSVKEMVKVLRKEDLVTIIVYASNVRILLQGEPGSNKETIYAIIDGLQAKGLSSGTEGMGVAYDNARQNYIQGGNNQIILVSDGMFNAENFSPKILYKQATQKAQEEKIITSAIGLGKNPEAIEFMQTLTEKGSGHFIQIKSETDAVTVLVNEIMTNSRKQ